MNQRKLARILLILSILIAGIACDRISKQIVRKQITLHEEIRVIDHVLILTRVENTGAFLSLGSKVSRPAYNLLMIILPLIMLGYAFYYLLFKDKLTGWMIAGLSLIIAGGAGNLFDRIFYGAVTDFIHIDLGFVRTGIFNVADLSITTGLVLILYTLYFGRKKRIPAAEDA